MSTFSGGDHFRDYDPSIGRYIESDPIGLEGGVNTYAYALQNPTLHSDRLGLDVTVCHWGAIPHIGIGVNSTQTSGRRVREEAGAFKPLVPLGWTVPGEVSRDHMGDVKECKVVPANESQDDKVRECIRRGQQSLQYYNLYTNSCVDFVRQCMSQALDTTYSNTNFPGTLYGEIH